MWPWCVHFDPPEDHKAYVHRSGRTARAGQGGVVLSLVQPDQVKDLRKMQRRIGLDEPITDADAVGLRNLSSAPERTLAPTKPERTDRSNGSRSSSGRGNKHGASKGNHRHKGKGGHKARSRHKAKSASGSSQGGRPASKQGKKGPSSSNRNRSGNQSRSGSGTRSGSGGQSQTGRSGQKRR